ncbi:hypothetical protein ES288_A10G109800v1 [Gossypium darwinii]|uniref:Uncharacterized protein n=2 Tax=Gossypium TaxID=3633 RepID=A0A5D2NP76_GOSTO|nr:hypothetical protein ES288_A10G109800v1 [Gossypium darwinii]TYI05722.1 hypothetical protein ES332_A10G109300v1 [Gossypium tomentosum]
MSINTTAPICHLLSSYITFFKAFSSYRKMDFMVPKAQRYVNSPEGNDTQTMINGNGVVSSQLQIAGSSPEGLDKQVVLRRIRYHKCKSKVQSVLQALVGSSGQAQEKWMEMGDAFTCP